jgi:adenine-specific DNA glycosylase
MIDSESSESLSEDDIIATSPTNKSTKGNQSMASNTAIVQRMLEVAVQQMPLEDIIPGLTATQQQEQEEEQEEDDNTNTNTNINTNEHKENDSIITESTSKDIDTIRTNVETDSQSMPNHQKHHQQQQLSSLRFDNHNLQEQDELVLRSNNNNSTSSSMLPPLPPLLTPTAHEDHQNNNNNNHIEDDALSNLFNETEDLFTSKNMSALMTIRKMKQAKVIIIIITILKPYLYNSLL